MIGYPGRSSCFLQQHRAVVARELPRLIHRVEVADADELHRTGSWQAGPPPPAWRRTLPRGLGGQTGERRSPARAPAPVARRRSVPREPLSRRGPVSAGSRRSALPGRGRGRRSRTRLRAGPSCPRRLQARRIHRTKARRACVLWLSCFRRQQAYSPRVAGSPGRPAPEVRGSGMSSAQSPAIVGCPWFPLSVCCGSSDKCMSSVPEKHLAVWRTSRWSRDILHSKDPIRKPITVSQNIFNNGVVRDREMLAGH